MTPSQNRIARALQRDVHCLFGLPVDNLTLGQTIALLREGCAQEGNIVLATINVNWVAESFRDATYREAIINSDLVVLDGKPLLWLAQLLGCPMRETVPGSSLIQLLLEESSEQPLTIFLFGGEGDAAERAMQRINERQSGGLRAVGDLNPGFGTVEEISGEAIVDTINAAAPDILLVALGAKKGTLWIERNRDRLNATIISHLGATINFLAGTVKRAPGFLQRCGLEWIWRILQEPKLVSRYTADGATLISFLLARLHLWWRYRIKCRQLQQDPDKNGRITIQKRPETFLVALSHSLQRQETLRMREIFTSQDLANRRIVLDFQNSEFADSAFLGSLLLMQHRVAGNLTDLILLKNWNCSMIRWSRLFHFFPNGAQNPCSQAK